MGLIYPVALGGEVAVKVNQVQGQVIRNGFIFRRFGSSGVCCFWLEIALATPAALFAASSTFATLPASDARFAIIPTSYSSFCFFAYLQTTVL